MQIGFFYYDGIKKEERLIKRFDTLQDAIDSIADFVRYELKFTSYYFELRENKNNKRQIDVFYGDFVNCIYLREEETQSVEF